MSRTEEGAPWVGDLVYDPAQDRTATVSDVRSDGTYLLRAPGRPEWPTEDPARLEIITRRADRVHTATQ